MSAETLLNAKDPIALYRRVFEAKEITPYLARKDAIRVELVRRERQAIIEAQCRREGSIPSLQEKPHALRR